MDNNIGFFLIALLFVIFVFTRHKILARPDDNLIAQLDQNGIWINGTVLKLQAVPITYFVSRSGKGGYGEDINYVTYQYQANGDTYEQLQYISRDLWDELDEGSQVDIVYLPDHPEKAMLVQKQMFPAGSA